MKKIEEKKVKVVKLPIVSNAQKCCCCQATLS